MSANKALCCFCRLPRADLKCEVCTDDVCRSCIERLPDETFHYLSEKPAELSHVSYCPRCHDSVVAPALARYTETLEKAKNVGYWARAYRGHVPVMKKAERELSVIACRDRSEVLMRLAFMAVEQGFNGLVRGELVSRKVRDHGYQKMEWSGSAVPCLVDEAKLERAEFNEAHWRVIAHR